MASKRKPDLKVVILGTAQIGKTTLIQRYLAGTFDNTLKATIGASFFVKQWGPFHAAIWDTAGEEKYQSLSSFYCRNATAAILAYDITDHESFVQLKNHYIPLLSGADADCLCVVVACKADLVGSDGEGRAVSVSAGKALSKAENSERRSQLPEVNGETASSWDCAFFETSSKTGHNVEEVFEFIQEVCLAGKPPPPDMSLVREQSSVVRVDQPRREPEKSGCC